MEKNPLNSEIIIRLQLLHEKKLDEAPNDRIRERINIIWDTMDSLRSSGIENLTVAVISRHLSTINGGPKLQSIYNKSGYDYSLLIKEYKEIINSEFRLVNKQKNNVEIALAMISDIGVRSILKQKIEWAKSIEYENDMLRAAYKELTIPSNAPINHPQDPVQDSLNETIQNTDFGKLSPRLIAALRKGISRDRLEERGMTKMLDGSITINGINMFPPGFTEAIETVLTISENFYIRKDIVTNQ